MPKFLLILFLFCSFGYGSVDLGVDVFFESKAVETLKGKKIGLVTNHTGINKNLVSTFDLFLRKNQEFELVAVFAPEHGISGTLAAEKDVPDQKIRGIPVYGLYGKTRRPTEAMLKNIDILVYDVQDIGVRSYTYASTLFYVMEEAAKRNIPLIVLDRPNPIGGNVTDGPMLEKQFRSFVGYIDVPYCHGMTIGELARYFNAEYEVNCRLEVIPMKGWKRSMHFSDTGLCWVPTSPYIPESDTPIFYASTGLIGQLSLVSIGIGHTLPFKVIGAPWICKEDLAKKLNEQRLPGVQFVPFEFIPGFGLYRQENCKGVLIFVSDRSKYSPVKVQHCILGILKSLYPNIVTKKLSSLSKEKKELFCKAEGTDKIFSILSDKKYPAWEMIEYDMDKRPSFLEKRKKYLLYD